MTWFKVDDGLPTHHKVLSIPRGGRRLAAMGAWTLGGAWSSKNLREGLIPSAVIEELAISRKVVADLVAAGLWLEVDAGYLMHDFLDYNPTAEQVKKDRLAAAERQQRARERAKEQRSRDAGITQQSRRDSRRDEPVSHGDVTPVVTVPPTRPDPTRPTLPLEEDTSGPSAPLVRQAPSGFAEWYAVYPRKVGRKAAQAAYTRAVRSTSPELLTAAARRFAADPTRDPAFTPHPATWLNQGRWEDEGPARPASRELSKSDQRAATGLALVAHFREQEGA